MQSNTIILHASSSSLPPSIFTARPEARSRLRDFFSSHIRNPNTRRAYMEAVRQFSNFCAEHGIVDLAPGRAGARGRVCGGATQTAFETDSEAAFGCSPDAVRLDGRRPGHPHKPRSRCSRAEAFSAAGQDAGAAGRWSPYP
jgi:hypothetical protein